MSIYTDHGYKDRNDYLRCLAEDYNVELFSVELLADLLGKYEDFDGLVSAVQDMEMAQ